MIEAGILFWLVAVLGVILTGVSKSGFAGGAGVVAVPLMALFIPVSQAVVIMLPLLLLMPNKSCELPHCSPRQTPSTKNSRYTPLPFPRPLFPRELPLPLESSEMKFGWTITLYRGSHTFVANVAYVISNSNSISYFT